MSIEPQNKRKHTVKDTMVVGDVGLGSVTSLLSNDDVRVYHRLYNLPWYST